MPGSNNGCEASRRRTFLKSTAGIATLGLIAGCAGGSDDGEDGGADPDTSPDAGDGESGETETPDDETETPDEETPESDFPERTIEFIVPYSPGGGYDTYTRLAAEHLPAHLPGDAEVVVRNVEGAGGIIGTEEIYNAEPDGHTNGIINVSKLGRDQIIDDVRFDIREISYYGTIALEVPLITVGPHTGIESWEDYARLVQDEELRFGTTGPASTTAANAYLPGEVSGAYPMENVLNNMVVYDGTSGMVQGILQEDIDVIAVAYSSALSYIRDGSVEPLMYLSTDSEPPEEISGAETLATAGVENGQQVADMVPTRRAFGGPPDLPEERLSLFRDAFETLLTDDEEMAAAAEEAERPITYEDGETTAEAVAGYVNGWEERQEILDKLEEY